MMDSLLAGMLISLLPIIELRGGIPFAIAHGINPLTAFIFCTLANIIIILPIFLFLDYLHKHLLKIKPYKKTFDIFLKRIRTRKKKVERNYQTYGIIALTFFVAIPLPITGAWTGTLIAWLLNLKRRRSFLAIALGIIIAGIIVTLATTGIITLFRLI
ncbi:MAG: small multi-drug export protein [Candidatus Pacearchaeota archaeon]|nr:MAG: small multi-drug export protein [Candidatus Pacearchaeota archaeon]